MVSLNRVLGCFRQLSDNSCLEVKQKGVSVSLRLYKKGETIGENCFQLEQKTKTVVKTALLKVKELLKKANVYVELKKKVSHKKNKKPLKVFLQSVFSNKAALFPVESRKRSTEALRQELQKNHAQIISNQDGYLLAADFIEEGVDKEPSVTLTLYDKEGKKITKPIHHVHYYVYSSGSKTPFFYNITHEDFINHKLILKLFSRKRDAHFTVSKDGKKSIGIAFPDFSGFVRDPNFNVALSISNFKRRIKSDTNSHNLLLRTDPDRFARRLCLPGVDPQSLKKDIIMVSKGTYDKASNDAYACKLDYDLLCPRLKRLIKKYFNRAEKLQSTNSYGYRLESYKIGNWCQNPKLFDSNGQQIAKNIEYIFLASTDSTRKFPPLSDFFIRQIFYENNPQGYVFRASPDRFVVKRKEDDFKILVGDYDQMKRAHTLESSFFFSGFILGGIAYPILLPCAPAVILGGVSVGMGCKLAEYYFKTNVEDAKSEEEGKEMNNGAKMGALNGAALVACPGAGLLPTATRSVFSKVVETKIEENRRITPGEMLSAATTGAVESVVYKGMMKGLKPGPSMGKKVKAGFIAGGVARGVSNTTDNAINKKPLTENLPVAIAMGAASGSAYEALKHAKERSKKPKSTKASPLINTQEDPAPTVFQTVSKSFDSGKMAEENRGVFERLIERKGYKLSQVKPVIGSWRGKVSYLSGFTLRDPHNIWGSTTVDRAVRDLAAGEIVTLYNIDKETTKYFKLFPEGLKEMDWSRHKEMGSRITQFFTDSQIIKFMSESAKSVIEFTCKVSKKRLSE